MSDHPPSLSRRTAVLAAVLSSALTGVLVGCSGTSADGAEGAAAKAGGEEDLSDVTLKVGDQVGLTQALLEASGQLENVPYKVEWSRFTAAAPLLEALRADAIDIGGAGDAPTLNAIAAGGKIKIAGTFRSPDRTGLALYVPEDSPVKTVADLKGKTVSPTTRGSIGHYLLLSLLERAGLNRAMCASVFSIRPMPRLPSARGSSTHGPPGTRSAHCWRPSGHARSPTPPESARA